MSFDSLALRHVIHEFRDTLLGGTIRHVEQLNPTAIAIKISQANQTHYVLMSSHAVHARTHLIERPPKGQKQSYFAEFLMTHIGRGTISDIEQIGWDRVLKITIRPHSDDPVETVPRAIIAEFMGKHSNIILTDESTGKILQSIKHIDESMSRHREILPGLTYIPPPQQEKLDPLALDHATFISLLEGLSEVDWRFLFNQIDGLSPMLAKEIIYRAGEPSGSEQLWHAYQEIIAHFDPAHSIPQVLVNRKDRNDSVAVSASPLHQFPGTDKLSFDTMSGALSFYYETVAIRETIQSERHALNQALEKLMDAVDRKIVSLHQDLANAEQAENYRIKGELLTANMHLVQRGDTSIEAQNYYTPELNTVQIELDPQLSSSGNAQIYFKKYTKAKRGRSVINQLIADNEADQEVLRSYTSEIDGAETGDKLRAIREEFVKKGWIKERKKGRQKRSETEGAFKKYTSPDGFQLYVGRNSKENDLLLRRIASGRDMWLHAKQIHGSHVIIRNPENKPGVPMPTLLQAAQIAAHFSKGKHSSHVPVDYTWARYVVKPKGSAAGFVHYTHEKTLYVEPRLPSMREGRG